MWFLIMASVNHKTDPIATKREKVNVKKTGFWFNHIFYLLYVTCHSVRMYFYLWNTKWERKSSSLYWVPILCYSFTMNSNSFIEYLQWATHCMKGFIVESYLILPIVPLILILNSWTNVQRTYITWSLHCNLQSKDKHGLPCLFLETLEFGVGLKSVR